MAQKITSEEYMITTSCRISETFNCDTTKHLRKIDYNRLNHEH